MMDYNKIRQRLENRIRHQISKIKKGGSYGLLSVLKNAIIRLSRFCLTILVLPLVDASGPTGTMDYNKIRQRLENRIRHQISKIKKGGSYGLLSVLKNAIIRLSRFCLTILVLPLVMATIILVRLIGPIYRIRFGYFLVERIGHFAFDIEYYLTGIKETKNNRSIDLFAFRGDLCNEQLGRMFRRRAFVHNVFWIFFKANRWLPGAGNHSVLPGRVTNGSRDLFGRFAHLSRSLCFTNDENSQGRRYLETLGMKELDRFVCLIVRDAHYLNVRYPITTGGWDYHSYRDSDLQCYEEAAQYLVSEGYWVVRMGKYVDKPLEFSQERIVDYANSGERCDLLDIWLMANCHFAISSSTGLDAVADAFRRPVVLVNFLPLSHFQSWSETVLVPKTLRWLNNDRRKLTLNEYLTHNYQRSNEYQSAGIVIEDLTGQEICDAVIEMHQRLSGLWHESEPSKLRQQLFWAAFSKWSGFPGLHHWINPQARIGDRYLEKSPELWQ